MKKKKLITSCILSLIMCASLLTGATYALFTSENTKNIAITSGNVEVTANIEGLVLTSPKSISASGQVADDAYLTMDGMFANGGTATLDESGNLTITKITAGDKAEFKIKITNKSNVNVKYRTIATVTNDDGLFNGLNVVVGGTSLNSNISYTEWTTFESSEPVIVDCLVELPTSAGNSYENKTCTIAFTVEAVQGNVEYETVTSSNAELKDTINNATNPTMIILNKETYKLPEIINKDITFKGNDDIIVDMSQAVNGSGSNIAFEGVTIQYADNSSYIGVQHTNSQVYRNCTIKGTMYCYGPNVEFIDCTFENMTDAYCVWTYGSNVTFTNCTFNTAGKAVLVYTEAKVTATVEFNNCEFNDKGDVSGKGAVEIGESAYGNKANYTIIMNDCVVNGFDINNGKENENPEQIITTNSCWWGNKNAIPADRLNVIIDGVDVY